MIINELYYKALDFAKTLHPSAPSDVVHDAFVDWYVKLHKSLFDEPEPMVMYMVRKTFNQYYRGKPFVRLINKVTQTMITPEDELIERELNLSFMSYEEIDARVADYEQYHTRYKMNLN